MRINAALVTSLSEADAASDGSNDCLDGDARGGSEGAFTRPPISLLRVT